MGEERRVAERVRVQLEARWEGVISRREGTVSDLSKTGCFILTRAEVVPGELIRMEIQSPTEGWFSLWGEVVYQIEEMGFAVSFTGSSKEEQTMLALLLDYLNGKQIDLDAYTEQV